MSSATRHELSLPVTAQQSMQSGRILPLVLGDLCSMRAQVVAAA